MLYAIQWINVNKMHTTKKMLMTKTREYNKSETTISRHKRNDDEMVVELIGIKKHFAWHCNFLLSAVDAYGLCMR